MHFRLSALLAVAAAATTLAAPVDHVPLEKRDVPIEKCTKRTSGYLTGVGGQKFAISKDGKHVVNAGSGSGGLKVEFQACNPNFTKYPNSGSGPYVGHIYVPKVKKCLQVPSFNPSTTYNLLLEDCYYSDDSGQFAYNFLQKGSNYYWSGATFSDGSLIQGSDNGCTNGLFGYQGAEGGAPLTSHYTSVACASGANVQPFLIK
eukprot:TRINITY_DN8438_c0_g1_i1.p1 TRINITY_DN8438_c0_g1~~TRINITY_DN8438_c0_g1_i1.p1  ORF type:complete len:203 (-),score=8.25 TRINITY_DN8438_c0_g1_i1:231-839(-)